MKNLIRILGLTFFTFLFINSCRSDELLSRKANYESLIQEAKTNFYKQTPNFRVLNITKKIDWENSIFNDGDFGMAIEVPLSLDDKLSINDINKNLRVYNRLLLIKNKDSWEHYYLFISSNPNSDENEINFYNIPKNFDGKIVIFDSKNHVIKNIGSNKKSNNNPKSAREDDTVTCWFYGWWYESGAFEPLIELGCSGGGDSGGSGTGTNYGGDGAHGGSGSGSTTQQDLCSKSKPSSSIATTNAKTATYISAKNSTNLNNGKENGVVFGLINGALKSTDVQTGNEHNLTLTHSYTNPIADLHRHTDNTPPSPGDFYSLIDAKKTFSNYNTRYIIDPDGTTYALVVTDTSAMNTFLQNYPPSINPNPSGVNYVNFPQSIFYEWADLKNTFSESGALAYILNKYNSGITLTKMDGAGNFRAVNITTTQNADGTTNYNYSLCPN